MATSGLLYSQVGYDLNLPMRAAVCADPATLGGHPAFALRAQSGRLLAEGPLISWGNKWGRDWWIIDFSNVAHEGSSRLDVLRSDGRTWRGGNVEMGKGLLWRQTFRHVALEQARKRAIFAQAKVGWFDAGMHWQEANSHASFIIGLTDVLEFAAGRLSAEERTLLEKQIVTGCDYLALCQDHAAKMNHPAGSLCHEVPKWEKVVLPHDAAKAVVAWARAARLCSQISPESRQNYVQCARKAFAYTMSCAPSNTGLSRIARGLPKDFVIPSEWTTRDLLMRAWGALELVVCGLEQHQADFAMLARQVMDRQIGRDKSEEKLFGHFYEFPNCGYSEKAWTHSIENMEWGIDAGATFPHYLVPLMRACELWPGHADAADWRRCVQRFAYGYFQPACSANPFSIVPLGYYTGEGLINFAGLWHGMNAAYGLAAAQATELAHFLEDRAFIEIAVGNMQWIAGLNVGITRESLAACVMFDTDIPENETLPASMIYGVGQRHAGGWTTMRGSICNGFSTGQQFKFDVAPQVANDGSITLTDEDWITHCGGWLSGLARLAGVS